MKVEICYLRGLWGRPCWPLYFLVPWVPGWRPLITNCLPNNWISWLWNLKLSGFFPNVFAVFMRSINTENSTSIYPIEFTILYLSGMPKFSCTSLDCAWSLKYFRQISIFWFTIYIQQILITFSLTPIFDLSQIDFLT